LFLSSLNNTSPAAQVTQCWLPIAWATPVRKTKVLRQNLNPVSLCPTPSSHPARLFNIGSDNHVITSLVISYLGWLLHILEKAEVEHEWLVSGTLGVSEHSPFMGLPSVASA